MTPGYHDIGGALMTPILLPVFGIAPVTAVGTDLWFAALTKLVATRVHHAAGLIDWGVVTAVGLVFQPWLQGIGRGKRLTQEAAFKSLQPILTVAAGAGLGVIVTLTSVGAGALCVVILTYLYPLRLTPARLIATDIVHAIPLALFAGLGHLLVGHVDFELLGWLLLGSIPGVFIGAKLSSKLPARFLRLALAVVLLAVALKLLTS